MVVLELRVLIQRKTKSRKYANMSEDNKFTAKIEKIMEVKKCVIKK